MFYTYICTSCHHVFEDSYSIEHRDVPCHEPCPECDAMRVTRPMEAPAVVSVVGSRGSKLNSAFKEVHRAIRKANPRNKMPDL